MLILKVTTDILVAQFLRSTVKSKTVTLFNKARSKYISKNLSYFI